MNKKTDFRAPQKALRTSWVQMAFSKPKSTGTIVKRSLGSRPTPIFKSRGVTMSNSNDSYAY